MPIVMTSKEWARLHSWMEPGRNTVEAKRQREYVHKLDEASHKMTKNWPNSLDNVNKRNEEIRRARLAVAEQANSKFYARYMKRKREERARLLYSARDIVFKNKDAPKMMLGAVMESVVQGERIAQLKFKAEQKKVEKEMKEKDDNEIIRKAAEWHVANAERRRKRFEVNKQHQQEIIAQARDLKERQRKEYEEELAFETKDCIEGKRQMEALTKFEIEFKAAEKARIFADMKRAKEEHDARIAESIARDQLDDRLIEVRQRSRARVVALRKKTEFEMKSARWAALEKVSQMIQSSEGSRNAAEEAARVKAVKQYNAAADERERRDARKRLESKESRQQDRKKYLADEEQRLHEENTRLRWEIINRFKNVELYNEYRVQLQEEKARKVKQFKEDTLKLWKERDEREARELAETRHFYGELALEKLRHADNRLLTYANVLIEEARRENRPELPLRRAIDRYCKLYGLYPPRPLPKSLREHFTRYQPADGSRPDAGFREPPPPPPDRGPDAPDEEPAPEPGRRDGLQPAGTGDPPKSKAPETQESVEDYKRAARANGLQRRNAQTDLKLPPIVVPCQTPDCTCDLKNKK